MPPNLNATEIATLAHEQGAAIEQKARAIIARINESSLMPFRDIPLYSWDHGENHFSTYLTERLDRNGSAQNVLVIQDEFGERSDPEDAFSAVEITGTAEQKFRHFSQEELLAMSGPNLTEAITSIYPTGVFLPCDNNLNPVLNKFENMDSLTVSSFGYQLFDRILQVANQYKEQPFETLANFLKNPNPQQRKEVSPAK